MGNQIQQICDMCPGSVLEVFLEVGIDIRWNCAVAVAQKHKAGQVALVQ